MLRTVLCWSGGKDCAWALRVLGESGVEIAALVSTLDERSAAVAMHRVRRELIEAQAAALDVPLWTVPLPWPCPNEEYERRMAGVCQRALAAGVTSMAFGDLHLADVRAYREQKLAGTGIEALFPLWGRPTEALAREMIAAGLEARVVSIDPAVMPRETLGRAYDAAFLESLPAGVDPCGENGEFHTFVHGGPMFRRRIPFAPGETREEGGFLYADLLPA